MKTKTIGQKIYGYGSYIGQKTYGGIRQVGQKVYDNRYKILAGIALTALKSSLKQSDNVTAQTVGANIPSQGDLDFAYQRLGNLNS